MLYDVLMIVQRINLETPIMRYVTPKVAAKMLGVNRSTIHRWRTNGTLNDYKRLGNRYVYSLDSIKELAGENLMTANDVIVDSIEDIEDA